MHRSISIVLVNWNSGHHLRECVSSLGLVVGDKVSLASVTIVDNASDDGSLDFALDVAGPIPVNVIRNTNNIGFAAACNQGAAASSSEFVLFLNPDTRLVSGCLQIAAEFLGDVRNQSVGIVGVQLLDLQGSVARTCSRRPTLRSLVGGSLGLDRVIPSLFPPGFLSDWGHDETRAVDQVMGAFYFVRRSLFETLGGFDERFFVYFEDLDFAIRARSLGWQTYFLASVSVFHAEHGTTRAIKARRLFYFCRSRIQFGAKHFGLSGAVILAATTLFVEPLVRTAVALIGGRLTEIRDIAIGFGLLWADVPKWLRGSAHA